MTSQPTYVIVENLPVDFDSGRTFITGDFLRHLFMGWDLTVEDAVIKNYKGANRIPYAYGIVKFGTRRAAERVVEEYNYTKLENSPICLTLVDEETYRAKKTGAGKLIIKGLDPEIQECQLHEALSNFGSLVSCKIPCDFDGDTYHSRGYGQVQFKNPMDAEQVCIDLKDASINGLKITIELDNSVDNEQEIINLMEKLLKIKG